MSRNYQNIFVAASYKKGTLNARTAVSEFATSLGAERYNMVYGGGFDGLMGLLMSDYDEALGIASVDPKNPNKHQPVVCVKAISTEFYAYAMPGRMIQRLLGNQNKIVVKDLQERKREMVKHSDAVVAFPGGIQTGDEVMEFAADNGYGKSMYASDPMKPIICVEPDGDDYEWLRVKLKNDIAKGYTSPETSNMFSFVSTGAEAIEHLNQFNAEPPKLMSLLWPNTP